MKIPQLIVIEYISIIMSIIVIVIMCHMIYRKYILSMDMYTLKLEMLRKIEEKKILKKDIEKKKKRILLRKYLIEEEIICGK